MITILTMSNTEKFILFGIVSLALTIYILMTWLPKWKKVNIYNKILRIILFSSTISYAFYVFKIFQEWANTAKPYIGVGKMMHTQLEDIFIKELNTNNIFLGSIILIITTGILSYLVKDAGRKKESLNTLN
ncbi:hypothetical protein [Chryseobacterium sp. 5_R23647]|uniref:hypothetical protein n=1 Tax=Chryseobacterium sp. 5_R23647 TaxID=2258964 RepID=UPI000E2222A2|nr:hypothetical protein [Chryseobacterium sp. 5_R23647]REC40506.1 hypothetical protein DRF69_18605 [Chryseobacterium sp. 5_R23647]